MRADSFHALSRRLTNIILRDYSIIMRRFSTPRLLIAAAIILGSAMVAGQVLGWPQRAFIMGVGGLFALLFAVPPEETRSRRREEKPQQRLSHFADFEILAEALPEPMLLVENGRVTNANSAAAALLGPQLVGQNVRTAIRHAGAIERLTDSNADHSGQPITITGLGQADQNWQMRIRNLASGQKLVLLFDRSATNAAEQMRVDFVANASHELMTPLAGIKGFIETLSDDEAGGDARTRHRFLGIMGQEAERMQALIRDLISLSRIQSERFELPQHRIDLTELAEEVIGTLQSTGKPRAADVRLISNTPPPILGDPVLVKQLLHNLIGNAMKYGRADTPVTVTLAATRSGTMANLLVEDEGEGIAPEHIPRLTERFYRVDSGRSRALGGTGLGLSLVKHIVDRHRGHLSIASTQGKGTRVTVLLPAQAIGNKA